MKGSLEHKNCSTCRRRYLHFFYNAAAWSVMLVLLQLILISPLDRGQKHKLIVFHKPVSSILGMPEDLQNGQLPVETDQKLIVFHKPINPGLEIPEDIQIGALPVDTSQKRPDVPPVRLKKGEHLFYPIIVKVANEHEIDPALIKAIIMAESGYNPKAISKRGAMGLMQLMPGTAEALGVQDIFDPEHNINGGVIYFKRLINLFQGDLKLALAAYNAGIRKVRMYQGIPPFKATRYYIKKVFKYYEHYRRQMTPDLKET